MEKSKVTGYNILQKFVRKEISRISGLEPEQLKRKEGESIEDFRNRLEKARKKRAALKTKNSGGANKDLLESLDNVIHDTKGAAGLT